jgi:hypothetical protein
MRITLDLDPDVAKRLERATWPNAYFAEHGLFSYATTYARPVNPPRGKNHQPESRMREIRKSGSEGGGPGT